MPKELSIEVIVGNVAEHPALRAWREVGSLRIFPERLERLKEGKKSAIYRLSGVGPGGSAVIAKRCPRGDLNEERLLYEQILPRLPVSALQYYGFVEDSETAHDWLFLEDANGRPYSPQLEAYRALAAQWLGDLHTSAADAELTILLPAQEPVHYLRLFWLARELIRRSLADPRLSTDDLAMLRRLLTHGEIMERNWPQIESFCRSFPSTLIHGDFVGKNIQVRSSRSALELLPFDWEKAGWGVPAVDLAHLVLTDIGFSASPDLPTYWETVRHTWKGLCLSEVQALARYGTIFRLLAAIMWSSSGLATHWPQSALQHLDFYERALADTLRSVGLGV